MEFIIYDLLKLKILYFFFVSSVNASPVKDCDLDICSSITQNKELENVPSAPCSSGSCSSSSSTTYETATQIITITITFIYFNGELVDVESTKSVTNKPKMPR